ncbi:hypothetical protein N0V93_004035 [Gnomoniopsis smithogilvyi]|uniref:Rhodopsin domain-containing protein n=1 Tax=Gnomoniopsis smithogilvyi TaxID=1191159 RepID=A0A9W8YXS2_9PEZI|nr:hypothetical protein N0V93_004035 [Gnomoniopsis smithogilvyi]
MATTSSQSIPPDDDYRYAYMAGIITATIVAVLVSWVRMYTRMYISHNLWWDDWVMFAATFLTIGTNAVLLQAYYLGLGRHIQYVPVENLKPCFMFLWIAEPTNLFALYAVRVSITLFFMRLIPTHKKLYMRIIWGIIWSLTISDIYVSINYFIQCRPIQKVWDTEIEGECLSDAAYQAAPWFYQAVSILTDLALMSIPIMMFRTLKVPTRTKIGIILLCCLGVFTCACAVVKTALLPALFDHTNTDKTMSLAQLCLWAPLEICIGMICGSLPCIKPLYTRLRHGDKSLSLSAASSSLGGPHRPSAYQLSDRKRFTGAGGGAGSVDILSSSGGGGGKPTGIYRSHNIEYSSGPAVIPRTESEDSILPRNMMTGYGGHVETQVRGPSAADEHEMAEHQYGRAWSG